MKVRLIIAFIAMLLIPLAVSGWFAMGALADERHAIERRMDEFARRELLNFAAIVDLSLKTRQQELMEITSPSDRSADNLRQVVRLHGMVRHIFALDQNGRLEFPPPGDLASEKERAFVERAHQIWEDRRLFSLPDEEGIPRPEEKNNYGWFSWYWDDGIQLVFWQRDDDGRTIGVELERMALLAEVIGALPAGGSSSEGPEELARFQLASSSAGVLYEWGGPPVESQMLPRAVVDLRPPLGAWRLELFDDPVAMDGGLSSAANWSFGLGFTFFVLFVVILALYVGRTGIRELEDARTRVTFVNQVSHELKTPLTNIRMYAELLEEELDGEDSHQHRYVEIIASESRRLSRLIGNVLSFSRGRQRLLAVHTAEININQVIRRVVEGFTPVFREAGISLELALDADRTVMADADALEQILSNLLSNVEKYAKKGRYARVESVVSGDDLIVRIVDGGPGVDSALGERAFRPFVRGSMSVTEGVSGTGIGLAISRQLARLQGGDLKLIPSQKGAVFQLVLRGKPGSGAEGRGENDTV